jgi:ketosteroid isomerase-like protein
VTTKDVVLAFLQRVQAKEGWEDLLSDELQFSNFAHPVRRTTGKQASLEGIRRFYAMSNAVEVESLIVEGQQACALTRYDLKPPVGASFESHIAEIFRVENGKIVSFGIFFDSAPYPKPASPTA